MTCIDFTKPPLGTPLDLNEPINQGLVAWWLNQEGATAGGRLMDLSLYKNDGILENTTHSVSGRCGPALKFDGAGDYVSLPSHGVFDLGDMTMSAWFKYSDVLANDFICVIGDNSPTGVINRLGLRVRGNGKVSFSGWLASTEYLVQDTGDYNNDMWHHVVGTRNGLSWALYIDGIRVDYADKFDATLDADWVTIGALRYGVGPTIVSDFTGQLDDIKIYNRAISVQEAELLYRYPFYGFADQDFILDGDMGDDGVVGPSYYYRHLLAGVA